jgi:hypothetical protein
MAYESQHLTGGYVQQHNCPLSLAKSLIASTLGSQVNTQPGITSDLRAMEQSVEGSELTTQGGVKGRLRATGPIAQAVVTGSVGSFGLRITALNNAA